MKKKISLLLCVLLVAVCFVGCSDKKDGFSNEKIESVESQSDLMFKLISETDYYIGLSTDEYLDLIKEYSEFEMNAHLLSLNQMLMQYQISSAELKIDAANYIDIWNAWIAAVDECGEFEELKDEFEVDEEKLTVSAEVEFKDRKATIMFSFDESGRMQSMDVSAHYDLNEILTKAGLNTLLGMGTVFAVLIFLALIISTLKYVPMLIEGMSKEKEEVSVVQETAVEEVVVEETDDLELIAVITAAIAAQEGTSTDGFVVRSIRRRPSNNWN